jgi:hypothetical protein
VNSYIVRRRLMLNKGNMWHTIRFPTDWQPWGDVSATVTGNPGLFKNVACAGIRLRLHVIGITDNGNIWHTIRFPTDWQPWGDVTSAAPIGALKNIACASIVTETGNIVNDLHVVGITDNGRMWHTIRSQFPPSWQQWRDVSATVTGNPGLFKNVACASIGIGLHVIGITDNGNMWHTIRFSITNWQQWRDVSATVTGNPGLFKNVACASFVTDSGNIVNDLHVVGIT